MEVRMTRTVVVTGSASGIGKATAALLAETGLRVIGVDLRDADVVVDLGTAAGRQALVDGVRASAGGAIDAVFACAGRTGAEPLTVSVNYFGVLATLEGLRPFLARGSQPRAVTIASIASIFPEVDQDLVEACIRGDEQVALDIARGKGSASYSSSKAALARWVRRTAIRPEWAGAGILLNAVAPGLIETPMTRRMIDDAAVMADLQRIIPMQIGRYGQPEEVAQLLRFLGSPENSYMVGQVIFIDGGGEATNRGDKIW
jgi:NAD(P)-dependent dehydrogenase (short-subunit alcohol dehydrogenase family)